MKIKPKRTFAVWKTGSYLKKGFLLLTCFLLASTISIYAQTKNISGIVTDASSEPLIGVTVRVQGTTTGTVTDIDGSYSLSASVGNVLEFSFVGMKSQTVTVGSQSVVNIIMEDDSQLLTETVVIGYGTAKKADLTGSIGSVNSDDIMKQPALNAVQSVQGKISGVNIINNDAPGSTPTIVIRGLGTALGGKDPLYIVDGFPADNIRNISPSDIVSMDILKDASSASIYGIRAANGVIIVTTKKGQSGSAKVGVESYVGVKTILKKVKMANASQYIEYFNQNQDLLKSYAKEEDKPNFYNLAPADRQAYNTDWYDELLQTGMFTNNVVSLSGGGKTIDYYLSYNYYDENGILDGQGHQRTTIRNNNVYKFFNDRLKFSQNLSISFSTDRPKPYGAFNEAYRQSPLVPVQFPNGRWGTSNVNKTTGLTGIEASSTDDTGKLNSIGNPAFTVANYSQKTKTLTIQGGIEGEFKLTDFLKVNSRFGATKYYYKDRKFENLKESWLASNVLSEASDFEANKAKPDNKGKVNWADNSLRYEDIETYRWIWEGFATFNKSFDKHNVEAVLGMSREKYGIGNTTILKGYDVPSRSQYWNIGMASGEYANEVNQYYYTPRALSSYFARVQYNFDNKYYFSGTIRRDGSSTFKANEDYWGTFPSVGFGWTVTKENFMQDVKFLNYLKLRGTWGKLGNQNVPLNIEQIYASTASSSYNYVFGPGQNMVYGAAYGSPVIPMSWEVTEEWGVGVDFAVLDDRLTGSIDYYKKVNDKAVLEVTPVQNTWYEKNFFAPGAKIDNSGLEFILAWSDKLSNGLRYDISVNYSYNKNRVKNVVPTYGGQIGGSLGDGQITKRLTEGQPLFAWWLLETDGVWQSQEEIDNASAKIGVPKVGHLKYKDQNNDGMIDDRDKVYMGSYLPSSNYGIHLGLDYKNFDFSIDGYGVAGNKVYNGLKHGRIDGGENITYETYKNRWTGAGSTNKNPGANRDSYSSDYFLESGAFFRINNITLGYTFHDLVFNGSKLRLYFTAQNPFMFTDYSGFSPEISGYSLDNTVPVGQPSGTAGVELSAYPTTRNFIFGFNLQF